MTELYRIEFADGGFIELVSINGDGFTFDSDKTMFEWVYLRSIDQMPEVISDTRDKMIEGVADSD